MSLALSASARVPSIAGLNFRDNRTASRLSLFSREGELGDPSAFDETRSGRQAPLAAKQFRRISLLHFDLDRALDDLRRVEVACGAGLGPGRMNEPVAEPIAREW